MVKQWVSRAFPACSSAHRTQIPNDIWKGNTFASQTHYSVQILCLSAEAVEETCHLLKKGRSILDQATQNCSRSHREQLFRNTCFVQDGRSKQEERSLDSRHTFPLKYMPNELWKHILHSVSSIPQMSVEFLLCALATGCNTLRIQRPLKAVCC